MALYTTVKVSSDAFFKKLSKCAEDKANRVASMQAFDMAHKLKFREDLDGTGRYPKWDGSGGKPSKNSSSYWRVLPKGNSFYLMNTKLGANNYHYPNILMYGTTKSKAQSNPFWQYGPSENIVVGSNGRLFSKQLPNGIQPWINKQKIKMRDDIKIAIGGCD